ncbi:MAG: hypothetical protein AAFQ98_26970, partial [Bacteroidota bacterium]
MLTSYQQAVLSRYNTEMPVANFVRIFQVEANSSWDAWHASVERLIHQHAILQQGVEVLSSGTELKAWENDRFENSWGHLHISGNDIEVLDELKGFSQTCFSASSPVVMKAIGVTRDAGNPWLMLVFHPAVVDHGAVDLLLQELTNHQAAWPEQVKDLA